MSKTPNKAHKIKMDSTSPQKMSKISNKAQKRKMDSLSPDEAMKGKRRLAASLPAMPVSLTVADTMKKRPATATAEHITQVSQKGSSLLKRRNTSSLSQQDEFIIMTKKRKLNNDQPKAEISLTTSECSKKRSAAESPSRSAKRQKTHLPSPHVQTAAVTKKSEHRTDEAAAEESKTTVDKRKKRPAPDTEATQSLPSSKRQRIESDAPNLAAPVQTTTTTTPTTTTSKTSKSPGSHQAKESKATKSQQSKPSILSPEEETVEELRKHGVPLLKISDINEITSEDKQFLGAGGYGSCSLVVHPKTKERLVIKTFSSAKLKALVKEAINLHELQLPGVQRLVGVCVPTRQLLTEFAGITLDKYFAFMRPFTDIVSVLLQISRILQHMLHIGFSHNDLKSGNICVLTESDGPKVTIIDLGIASRVGNTLVYPFFACYTAFPWVAPELLLHTGASGEASDVYSLPLIMKKPLTLLEITSSKNTSLTDLTTWIKYARRLDPSERPRLSELTDLLQVLHQQATQENKQ